MVSFGGIFYYLMSSGADRPSKHKKTAERDIFTLFKKT